MDIPLDIAVPQVIGNLLIGPIAAMVAVRVRLGTLVRAVALALLTPIMTWVLVMSHRVWGQIF